MIGLLFDSVVKISLVLAAALVLTALLRRSSAAVRHWILAAAVVVAAAMPLLQLVTPAWGRPLASSWLVSDITAVTAVPAASTSAAASAGAAVAGPAAQAPQRPVENRSMLAVLPAILVVGSGLMLALLAVGLARLVWLTRRALPIRDGEWHHTLGEMLRRAGVRRTVAVRQSEEAGVLLAWGGFRPEIILPAASRTWSGSRVRIVLAHELAHITRHDWPLQIVAELLRAACWFNPLVWVVVGRLRSESERACDDAVMSSGVGGADYAAELLGIATELRGGRRGWLPAPAMARASHLEGRVAAMLNSDLNRTPWSPARRATSLVVALALAVAVSGYAISAQTFSSIAGSVSDQLGGLVPNATLVLVHKATGSKYEVKSNRVGMFEFVGLPAGEYSLATSVPGFKTMESTLVVGGQTLRRDVSLELGTLEETIRVVGRRSTARLNQPPSDALVKLRQLESARERYLRMQAKMVFVADTSVAAQGSGAAPACGAAAPPGLGGAIRVPAKTKDVRPVYPESALQTGTDGLVELGAVIGTDGTIQSVRINGDADPALTRSAKDAVTQWEYTPTLLNCVAVNVQMRVHVRFVLED